MRSLSAVCIALALGAVTYAKDSGFEGRWQLDTGQSSASANLPDHLEEQIKQTGNELVIQSRWREPQDGVTPMVMLGVMSSEIRLKTDGSQGNDQIGPFQTMTTSTQEGNKLVTKWQAAINGKQINGEWTRTLSPDGRTMTLDIQQTPDGGSAGNAHLVFKRR